MRDHRSNGKHPMVVLFFPFFFHIPFPFLHFLSQKHAVRRKNEHWSRKAPPCTYTPSTVSRITRPTASQQGGDVQTVQLLLSESTAGNNIQLFFYFIRDATFT